MHVMVHYDEYRCKIVASSPIPNRVSSSFVVDEVFGRCLICTKAKIVSS